MKCNTLKCGLYLLAFLIQPILSFEARAEQLLTPISETVLPMNDREKALVSHAKASIAKANKRISKLTSEVLNMEGMSSPKVRYLLNNLCSLPNTVYLEIGCWKGSTWVAGLFRNQANILSAVAIDNWSEFDGPKEIFYENCAKFLPNSIYQIYSADCFALDPKALFNQPVTVYFYDGNHSALSQELAFTHYNDSFDDVFIAIVDDWNMEDVVKGTRAAFEKLHYEILFEMTLPTIWNCDTQNWWNGILVAVIRKPIL